ncbi:MAG: PAS domain S-box protein [Myxococcales bacterium]|nr:PAS domain S-box protein [Myxococcales bacterium]
MQPRGVELESEIAKGVARLQAIVDSAVDAIVTIDERGRIETFNPAAERLFGYRAEELVGHNVTRLMTTPDRDHHDEYLRAYLSGQPPRIIGKGREVVGQRKDGTTFPLHLSVGEARFPGGRLFTGILRDLSEVKQLEREFLQSQKMEAVGRLTSGIAHDFNNLLMGIIGCADMALAELEPDTSTRKNIEDLRGAAQRGAAIVRNLLKFGRRSIEQAVVVDLCALLGDLKPMLTRLLGEDVELEVSIPSAPALVRWDTGQLEQVVMNLVVNARHAMPDGGRLTISVRDDAGWLLLQVTDTGCGMDEATLARIFEPFFTTRTGDGTGLGLSTARGLIERAGGSITVESAPGQGTTFSIRLPRAKAPEAPKPRRPPTTTAAAVTTQAARVLVVEDEKLVRLTVRHYLEKAGYQVLEAGDGERAMMTANQEAFDVLLTDMTLPGISGQELASALTARLPTLPVIFMTAHEPEDLRASGRLPEQSVALKKPFDESELVEAIRFGLSPGHR